MKKIPRVHKVIIGASLAGLTILSIVVSFGVRVYKQKIDHAYLVDSCSAHVSKDIETYSASYITASGKEHNLPFNAQDAKVIASSVTRTLAENLAPSVTSTSIGSLEKNVENAVKEQMDIMDISLTSDEYRAFIAGIQILVNADIYRTISNSGPINENELDLIYATLEKHMQDYGKYLSMQNEALDANMVYLDSLLKELADSREKQDSKADILQRMLDDITILQRLVSNVEAGRALTTDDKQALRITMDALCRQFKPGGSTMSLAAFQITPPGITSLRNSIQEAKKEMDSENAISDNTRSEILTYLSSIKESIECSATENAEQIHSSAKDLKELNDHLETSLASCNVQQMNFSNMIDSVQGSEEGAIYDEKIYGLCQNVAKELSLDPNNGISEKLAAIQNLIGNLQELLEDSTGRIDDLENCMSESVTLLHKVDISKDAFTLTELTDMLQSLQTVKKELEDESENGDQKLNETLDYAISQLQNAIENDISTIKNDFSDLSNLLEQATARFSDQDTALGKEITEVAGDVKAFLETDGALTKEELRSLEKTLIALQSSFAMSDSKHDSENQLSQDSFEHIQSSLERLDRKEAMTDTDLEELRNALENMKKALSSYINGENSLLSSSVSAAVSEIDKLEADLINGQDVAAERISTLSSSLDIAKAEFYNSFTQADNVMRISLEESLNSAVTKLETLLNDEENAKDEAVSSLATALFDAENALNSSIAILENQMTLRLANLSSSLTENIADVDNRSISAIMELNDAKSLLAVQLADLSDILTGAERDISGLQKELSLFKNTTIDINAQQDEAIATKASNAELMDAVSSINLSIESGRLITNAQIDNLNKAIGALEATDLEFSSELEEQILKLTSSITRLDEQDSSLINNLNNAIESLGNTISTMRTNTSVDISALQKQIDELNQKLKNKITYSTSDGINTITIH